MEFLTQTTYKVKAKKLPIVKLYKHASSSYTNAWIFLSNRYYLSSWNVYNVPIFEKKFISSKREYFNQLFSI